MEGAKDTKNIGTMADYLIRQLEDEKNGLENAKAFLKAAFLSSAVDALFNARRKAGLTQEQVAQKLGKKQEAIARWEADKEGRMSLRQYFDLALASGRVPLSMALEPIESVRDFVIAHPEEPQAPDLYYAWLHNKDESITVSLPITTVTVTVQGGAFLSTTVSRSPQESMPTAKSADQYLKEVREQGPNRASFYSVLQRCEYATNTTSNLSRPSCGTVIGSIDFYRIQR